jgi:putative selenate reductase molybdopterin-binding subunit
VIVTSSDTDLTPFDTGAYASSTTYVSGDRRPAAAEDVRGSCSPRPAEMLDVDPASSRSATSGSPRRTALGHLEKIALRALYGATSTRSRRPPRRCRSLAGPVPRQLRGGRRRPRHRPHPDRRLRRRRRLRHRDQPRLAEGQVEGAVANGIGYALYEDLAIDDAGGPAATTSAATRSRARCDLPRSQVVLVDSYDPTGPMGAKSIAEIGINAPLPTIANAVHDATGIWLTESPFTAERVLRALGGLGG